jgi:hypothetical protein
VRKEITEEEVKKAASDHWHQRYKAGALDRLEADLRRSIRSCFADLTNTEARLIGYIEVLRVRVSRLEAELATRDGILTRGLTEVAEKVNGGLIKRPWLNRPKE